MFRDVAQDQLLLSGVFQGIVQNHVVLAHGVGTQALGLHPVEVLLDLGGGQLVQVDGPQSRREMIADNHVVAVDRTGGAAGFDDLLQPVGQPLAYCQLLQILPPAEQVHPAPAVQCLNGQLQRGIALDGPPGRLTRRWAVADGHVIAAALGVVGDVGQNGLSGHGRYLLILLDKIGKFCRNKNTINLP